MSKKPTVLMILDGYGLNEKENGNAVAQAATPVMDKLMAEYPFVHGNASGMAVGLPNGQMGNSEVGHLNMGAGRIVYQDLTKQPLASSPLYVLPTPSSPYSTVQQRCLQLILLSVSSQHPS